MQMERQEVIHTLESLANGVDPQSGAAIAHDVFESPSTVRALFTAATLLKNNDSPPEKAPRPATTRFAAAGSPWTAEEEARLASEFDSGDSIAQIALRHGRSSGAISLRLVKLGRLDSSAVKVRERASRPAS
jgi:hypothetical protein